MPSGPDLPLITVYLPTHNRKELVTRAINSVLAQDYPNLELIVVDDGSSDGTDTLLHSFYGANSRIRIFRQETPKGACAARNLAIQHAKGQLLTGIDDDDEFLPHRLSTLYRAYDEKYAFVCSGYVWDYGWKSRERFVSTQEIDLNDILNLNHASNQVLVSTDRVKQVGGFDENLVSCQDYDLWVRLIVEFGSAYRIDEATYIAHVGHEKERISTNKNKTRGYLQFFEKHKGLMSKRNITNQAFLRLVAEEQKLTSLGLFRQIIAGYPILKLRYFLSSRFRKLARYRQYYLKHGKLTPSKKEK